MAFPPDASLSFTSMYVAVTVPVAIMFTALPVEELRRRALLFAVPDRVSVPVDVRVVAVAIVRVIAPPDSAVVPEFATLADNVVDAFMVHVVDAPTVTAPVIERAALVVHARAAPAVSTNVPPNVAASDCVTVAAAALAEILLYVVTDPAKNDCAPEPSKFRVPLLAVYAPFVSNVAPEKLNVPVAFGAESVPPEAMVTLPSLSSVVVAALAFNVPEMLAAPVCWRDIVVLTVAVVEALMVSPAQTSAWSTVRAVSKLTL